MNESYGRDLDLNLLRVFAVVAAAGSVTGAAARLYLTQPAVSAALKRLTSAVGAPLFARQGRGLALTARGQRLLDAARPHLDALVRAALSPPAFDPRTSDRVVRLGLSDASEAWLLPALARDLAESAPEMKLIVVPVQFRTVGEALASQRVDLAVTVADELPAGTRRATLFVGGFVCLYDPRGGSLPRPLTREAYFAREHVLVSYNGDLRGVVEDVLGEARRARVSVPSFTSVPALIDGSSRVATVPAMVARMARRDRPHLRAVPLPFDLGESPMELLWRGALDDDEAMTFVRERVTRAARLAQA